MIQNQLFLFLIILFNFNLIHCAIKEKSFFNDESYEYKEPVDSWSVEFPKDKNKNGYNLNKPNNKNDYGYSYLNNNKPSSNYGAKIINNNDYNDDSYENKKDYDKEVFFNDKKPYQDDYDNVKLNYDSNFKKPNYHNEDYSDFNRNPTNYDNKNDRPADYNNYDDKYENKYDNRPSNYGNKYDTEYDEHHHDNKPYSNEYTTYKPSYSDEYLNKPPSNNKITHNKPAHNKPNHENKPNYPPPKNEQHSSYVKLTCYDREETCTPQNKCPIHRFDDYETIQKCSLPNGKYGVCCPPPEESTPRGQPPKLLPISKKATKTIYPKIKYYPNANKNQYRSLNEDYDTRVKFVKQIERKLVDRRLVPSKNSPEMKKEKN